MNKAAKKKLVKIIISILSVFIAGICFFLWYVSDYYKPSDDAVQAVSMSSMVKTEEKNGMLIFTPNNSIPQTGFIFYPGGKVDYHSYSLYMREIAKNGYLCVVPKMPFNLAMFNINAADKVIADYPQIKNWVIGGHSLGGVMASSYAVSHNNKLNGIVFWASYPSKDMSSLNLSTVSLYGTDDRVISKENYQKSISKLPKNAQIISIDGANHCQFGDYGFQKGDGTAELSRDEQRKVVVADTVKFLHETEDK